MKAFKKAILTNSQMEQSKGGCCQKPPDGDKNPALGE